MVKKDIWLEYSKIISTLEKLEKRIEERFPDSGLREVINDFLRVARQSKNNIEWISKPHFLLRFFSYSIIVLAVSAVIYSISQINFRNDINTISNIITTSEALFNELVLIGAAIFFMITIETRVKRHKASKFLNELRVIAHVIDMHQLTKDPGMHDDNENKTESSPSRQLSIFELQRYLDYCSEAFSLIGKVAALYAQSLPNEVVVRTVNEIEELSSGLSRKVWQKLIILNDLEGREIKFKRKAKKNQARQKEDKIT
ncbi:MAG: hypothetical protein U0W24_14650 [Bacteroidales bacterium]